MTSLTSYRGLDPSILRGRSILVVGETKTGKTVLLEDFLYLLDTPHTCFYLFAPEDHELKNNFPRVQRFSPDQLTAERLDTIFEAASKIMKIKKHVSRNYLKIISIISSFDNHIAEKLRQKISKIRSEVPSADTKKLDKCIFLIIRHYVSKLTRIPRLSEEDERLIRACKFRIDNFVVIIDDLTENIELLCKTGTESARVMTKITTKCRHVDLTLIMSFHFANKVNPLIRTNSRLIFWTSQTQLECSKTGAIQGYPKDMIKQLGNTSRVFNEEDRYKKIFFNRQSNTFGTYEAKRRKLGMLGTPELHNMGQEEPEESLADLLGE